MKNQEERDTAKKIHDFSEKLHKLESSTEQLEELDLEEVKWTSVIDNIEKTGIITRFENDIVGLKANLAELTEQRKVAIEQQSLLSRDLATIEQINVYNTTKLRRSRECNEM